MKEEWGKAGATRWAVGASGRGGFPSPVGCAPRGEPRGGGWGCRGNELCSARLARPPRRLFSPACPPASAARGAARRARRLRRAPSRARGAARSGELRPEKPTPQSKTTEKCAPPAPHHPQFRRNGNLRTSSCRAKPWRLRRGLPRKRRGHPSASDIRAAREPWRGSCLRGGSGGRRRRAAATPPGRRRGWGRLGGPREARPARSCGWGERTARAREGGVRGEAAGKGEAPL